MLIWQTSRRKLLLDRTLVMGIMNMTPDSFSDGGEYFSVDSALRRAEILIAGGVDILDIGGESTRPGSEPISAAEEMNRIVPVIEAVSKRFDVPISVDTTKSDVAEAATAAGAEIINDISGLRFDERVADVAARSRAGLTLMHSRGSFEAMHSQTAVENILADVAEGLRNSIKIAARRGVIASQIVLDVGIGFGKTFAQNLELLARLDKIASEFDEYPILIGASRKSFIGKILDDAPAGGRLGGSIAAALMAVRNGANIIRTHDVRETVAALKVAAMMEVISIKVDAPQKK